MALETEMPVVHDTASSEATGDILTIRELVIELVKIVALAFLIIVPIHNFLFQPFFVSGSSMEPNFDDGEYLVVNELGYKQTDALKSFFFEIPLPFTVTPFRELAREDIAVFEYSREPEQYYIKRVIGLPGETIEIRGGRVVIYNSVHPQGVPLDEEGYLPRMAQKQGKDMARVQLGRDEYFLMGDNRSRSHDSRDIGPIKKDKIIGRVLLRAWPISQFAWY